MRRKLGYTEETQACGKASQEEASVVGQLSQEVWDSCPGFW